MTILQQLVDLYEQHAKDRDAIDDLAYAAKHGHIFHGPDFLIFGWQAEDGWYVHAAIGKGCLKKFLELMPYYLPYVGWSRPGRGRKDLKWHSTEQLQRKAGLM